MHTIIAKLNGNVGFAFCRIVQKWAVNVQAFFLPKGALPATVSCPFHIAFSEPASVAMAIPSEVFVRSLKEEPTLRDPE